MTERTRSNKSYSCKNQKMRFTESFIHFGYANQTKIIITKYP